MSKVVAIIYTDRFKWNFNLVKNLIDSKSVTGLILYGNGVEIPEFDAPDSIEIFYMTSEVKVSVHRVYRQIMSLVTQSYSYGKLIILSEIYRFESIDFLDMEAGTLLIPEKFDVIEEVGDLLNLSYPMNFIPILEIANVKYALQSRNLYDFLRYFTSELNLVRSREIVRVLPVWYVYPKADVIDAYKLEHKFNNLINLVKDENSSVQNRK